MIKSKAGECIWVNTWKTDNPNCNNWVQKGRLQLLNSVPESYRNRKL